MRLTRRELGTALVAGVAAAQTPAPLPASPEDELESARDRLKAMMARLAAQAVPMATEPAFRFGA
jgi:hypothetical protein